MSRTPTDEQYRAAAKLHQIDGDIEIDDNAPLSKTEGNPESGCYVQAWIWVADEETESL